MTELRVAIQSIPIDVNALHSELQQGSASGAVVTFTGMVRDYNQSRDVLGLSLSHYPGMTERALEQIVQQATERWRLEKVTVVHRVGDMALSETIVFVGCASRHRRAAFEACAFIMDYLKTEAPFWKKELTQEGAVWVSAEDKDTQAKRRWS
uniref:molybdopterin synthase catalytic subunit MoaE n=1 Tax=Thaumasiovibrio occultus TaxID=1891184 RepID=UPI000B358EAD|nr:molybdopterin synthase catalytic subunit MoaE [Thaumasiovibrio occultus]